MIIYKNCWKFIKENRIYFLIVSLIFLAFILIGFIFPIFFADKILEFMKQILEQTKGMNFLELFWFILQNNVSTAFFAMILGILFGVVPIINSVVNGYVLGFVMNKTSLTAGTSNLLRLLPHGIFEIPALIIALGLGLRIGIFIFKKKKKKDLKYSLENSLKIFVFIVLPLLLIAALIETALIMFLG